MLEWLFGESSKTRMAREDTVWQMLAKERYKEHLDSSERMGHINPEKNEWGSGYEMVETMLRDTYKLDPKAIRQEWLAERNGFNNQPLPKDQS